MLTTRAVSMGWQEPSGKFSITSANTEKIVVAKADKDTLCHIPQNHQEGKYTPTTCELGISVFHSQPLKETNQWKV